MTLLILWSLVVSALITLAASAAERIAAFTRIPRRFVWLVALIATAAATLLAARPHTSAAPQSGAQIAAGTGGAVRNISGGSGWRAPISGSSVLVLRALRVARVA